MNPSRWILHDLAIFILTPPVRHTERCGLQLFINQCLSFRTRYTTKGASIFVIRVCTHNHSSGGYEQNLRWRLHLSHAVMNPAISITKLAITCNYTPTKLFITNVQKYTKRMINEKLTKPGIMMRKKTRTQFKMLWTFFPFNLNGKNKPTWSYTTLCGSNWLMGRQHFPLHTSIPDPKNICCAAE